MAPRQRVTKSLGSRLAYSSHIHIIYIVHDKWRRIASFFSCPYVILLRYVGTLLP